VPAILVNNYQLNLTNLDKILWPEPGISKGDLINYYIEIYPYLKNFLKDRPLALKIYPDGINGKSFFQKNLPVHAPEWLSSFQIYSSQRKEPINWLMVNKLADLIWVANSASLELHAWFSTINNLKKPSFAVFDLDPGELSSFSEVIQVAFLIKEILDELGLKGFPKTSGQAGLHIYLPFKEKYNYQEVKDFLRAVASTIVKLAPALATTEWRKKERAGKVYIDYRQNDQGKTLPVPYSLRPTPLATVSTPLDWEELRTISSPELFTIKNIRQRIKQKGDLWQDILNLQQDLPSFLLK
jgi:bifunctional non-homologous end joining protein LigD